MPPLHSVRWLAPCAALVLAVACGADPESPTHKVADRGPVPDSTAPAPKLKRLTSPQYRRIIADVFSEDIQLPATLEADERVEGLYQVGAATTSISSYGVEKYEGAAYDIAEQVLASQRLRARWVPCDGETIDEICATDALDELGRMLWGAR